MLAFRPGTGITTAGGQPEQVDIAALATAGHYLALRVVFQYPMLEVDALPDAWKTDYLAEGLTLADPVYHWVHTRTGVARWSALGVADPKGVLDRAARHGLRFGVVVSVLDQGPPSVRSWGSFARPDREFEEAEMSLLEAHVRARHEAHVAPTNITPAELDALRLLKTGQRLKQIAWSLGVTEGAVKQRLKSVRAKLDAKTGAEAISRAASMRLI